jgi:hypothetical protein
VAKHCNEESWDTCPRASSESVGDLDEDEHQQRDRCAHRENREWQERPEQEHQADVTEGFGQFAAPPAAAGDFRLRGYKNHGESSLLYHPSMMTAVPPAPLCRSEQG